MKEAEGRQRNATMDDVSFASPGRPRGVRAFVISKLLVSVAYI